MKKYTSLPTYLFLLLLLNRSVLAIHSETALTALSFNHHNGVWMNKGIIYSRCTSAQFDRPNCANFSLIHSLVTKSQVIRPDCSFLVHRISCALHKLNCPSYPESSFQFYAAVSGLSRWGGPAQSLVALKFTQSEMWGTDVHTSGTGGLFPNMYDIPCQSSCHATIDICAMQVARSQQHYSSRNWQTHPKRSASVFHPSTSPTYLRPAPSLWQAQPHRIPPSASQSVWPWRPFIPSSSTISTQRRIPRTSLDSADGSDSIWKLHHDDCRLLPSGGCDDWARRLVKHHSYYDKDCTSKIRQNPACPQNYQESCGKIFPKHFTKIDWIKGNFTVGEFRILYLIKDK
ncbi:hypothetical protein ACTXT7_000130 [Hymenolepis weldensis]